MTRIKKVLNTAYVGKSQTRLFYLLTAHERIVNCYRCSHFQFWIGYRKWFNYPASDPEISRDDIVDNCDLFGHQWSDPNGDHPIQCTRCGMEQF